MTTLADMVTDISLRLVLNGSGKDTEITNCIYQAIRMNQRKRYWFLRKIDSVTLTVGAGTVSVPTDFSVIESVDLIYLTQRYTNKTGFRLLDFDEFKRLYMISTTMPSGTPTACALLNRTLYVNYLPTVEMTLDFTYFQKDAALPSSAQTSVWFDDGYDLIRSTAQYLMESSVLQNPDASPSEMNGMQAVLDEQHTFYERARR